MSTDVDTMLNRRAPLRDAAPASVGQATAVEQSRAIAEVKAAVVVAQQCPRDVQAAVAAMRESCEQEALAQRAFFRYNRGGSQITGPSVHLARELARVWGNIDYGIAEMRRDDQAGESEMLAKAWDVQTNTRNSSIFIVKHRRDTKNGQKDLTDLRDVYENNANQGARRVREAIFAVLPPWLVEEAKTLCMKTIEEGGGKPLAQRIADAVKWFETCGIRLSQLEVKLGRPRVDWEAADVAQLEVIGHSLQNGEANLADEFPAPRMEAADFTAPPSTDATAVAGKEQLTRLGVLLREQGFTDKAEGLAFIAAKAGRTVKASKELTPEEADVVIAALEAIDEPVAAEILAEAETDAAMAEAGES